jgi:hypothetical protein
VLHTHTRAARELLRFRAKSIGCHSPSSRVIYARMRSLSFPIFALQPAARAVIIKSRQSLSTSTQKIAQTKLRRSLCAALASISFAFPNFAPDSHGRCKTRTRAPSHELQIRRRVLVGLLVLARLRAHSNTAPARLLPEMRSHPPRERHSSTLHANK